jgi:Family of unknown function (DUF5522)
MADRDQLEDPGATPPKTTAPTTQDLAPEDFYFEGPYMVFTEAYHLKRGYCCNSDCRHCPYR